MVRYTINDREGDAISSDAYRLPAESGRWQAVGSVFWGEDDSDVDFHDAEITSVSLGLLYCFGAR